MNAGSANLLKLGPYGALIAAGGGVAELARVQIIIPSEALLALVVLGILAVGYGLIVERWQAMQGIMTRMIQQGEGCALSSVRWAQVDEALDRVAEALEADIAQRQVDAANTQKVVDALNRYSDQMVLIVKMQEIVNTMQESARGKAR